MKDTLQPGLESTFAYTIPPGKTVPHLYPESQLFREMPEVLATGYLVGLLEWAAIELVTPHLDWPREQSLGTAINVTHLAATPPGLTVTVKVRITEIDGRRIRFSLTAHDGVHLVSEGTHERAVIERSRFDERMAAKRMGDAG